MDDMSDILARKAEHINADDLLDELSVIKAEIARFIPGAKFNVPKIYPGRKALVVAEDNHSASEIKFGQIAIVRSLGHTLKQPLTGLVVIVR